MGSSVGRWNWSVKEWTIQAFRANDQSQHEWGDMRVKEWVHHNNINQRHVGFHHPGIIYRFHRAPIQGFLPLALNIWGDCTPFRLQGAMQTNQYRASYLSVSALALCSGSKNIARLSMCTQILLPNPHWSLRFNIAHCVFLLFFTMKQNYRWYVQRTWGHWKKMGSCWNGLWI